LLSNVRIFSLISDKSIDVYDIESISHLYWYLSLKSCNSQKVTSGISLQWSTKSSDIYNNLASAINDYDV